MARRKWKFDRDSKLLTTTLDLRTWVDPETGRKFSGSSTEMNWYKKKYGSKAWNTAQNKDKQPAPEEYTPQPYPIDGSDAGVNAAPAPTPTPSPLASQESGTIGARSIESKTKKAKPAPRLSYRVQSGDTLSAIAKRNNITLAKLLRLNPALTSDPKYKGGNVIFRNTKINLGPGAKGKGSTKPATKDVKVSTKPATKDIKVTTREDVVSKVRQSKAFGGPGVQKKRPLQPTSAELLAKSQMKGSKYPNYSKYKDKFGQR